jgi:hypothetical protein
MEERSYSYGQYDIYPSEECTFADVRRRKLLLEGNGIDGGDDIPYTVEIQ